MRVGIIPDLHEPFVHPLAKEFITDTFDAWAVNKVVCIGDIVDNHALSFWDHDPNGKSASDEKAAAVEGVATWYNLFPDADVCIGNHDERHYRAARKAGIPDSYLKGYREVWRTPRWNWQMSHCIDGILYEHGTGSSGKDAAINRALQKRISLVMGHTHAWAGVKYHASEFSRIFGLNVGCVDYDTEYMSPTGWKKIGEYTQEMCPVLQYNVDGSADFVVPSHYINLPCDEFNFIETEYGLSKMFCDDHRVIYRKYWGDKGIAEIRGRDLVQVHNSTKAGFQGRFITTFNSTGGVGVGLDEASMRVQIAFHADGTILPQKSLRGAIALKKERKKLRLVELLQKANIEFIRNDYANGVSKFIFTPPLPTKHYDGWWSCTADQLRIVCDEVLYWDGNQSNAYYSTSKTDCDFIQYAFSATGSRASIGKNTDCYRVIISRNKDHRTITGNPTKVEIQRVNSLDGRRYCFTVPSGMLVLRKNDSIFITGNCLIDCRAYAFAYGMAFPNRPILGCGVVIDGEAAYFEPMPCGEGEKYNRKRK